LSFVETTGRNADFAEDAVSRNRHERDGHPVPQITTRRRESSIESSSLAKPFVV